MNLSCNTLYSKQIYTVQSLFFFFTFSCSPDSIYGCENKIEAANISTGISVRVHFQMRWFCTLVAAGSITVSIKRQNRDPFSALCHVQRRCLL